MSVFLFGAVSELRVRATDAEDEVKTTKRQQASIVKVTVPLRTTLMVKGVSHYLISENYYK